MQFRTLPSTAPPWISNVSGTKAFTNIPFQGFQPSSGYTAIASGGVAIQGLQTGTTTAVFIADIGLTASTQNTLVATGFAINNRVVIISASDNNLAPANGKVEFRVINASPSGPNGIPGAVDIYMVPVGSTPASRSATLIVSNLGYRSMSPYVVVDYNSNSAQGFNYTMFVTATGTTTPILITQSLTAGTSSAGAIRTLVLTDEENADQLDQRAIVLNDLN